jgi:hypothetical protein
MAYIRCKICGSKIRLQLSGSSEYSVGPFGKRNSLEKGNPIHVQCRTCTMTATYERNEIVDANFDDYYDD